MKIKYAFFAVVCAAAMFLTGCGKDLICENGIATIKKANIKLSFPESWITTVGDDVYDEMYRELSEEYGSVDELKKSFEDNGERLLLKVQPQDGSIFALFSEVNKGEMDARELLKAVQNTSILGFESAGFYTESSFDDLTWGGVSGVMSNIKVSEKEGDPVALEEREFCFEYEDLIFSLKIHIIGGFEQEADSIEISAIG